MNSIVSGVVINSNYHSLNECGNLWGCSVCKVAIKNSLKRANRYFRSLGRGGRVLNNGRQYGANGKAEINSGIVDVVIASAFRAHDVSPSVVGGGAL